MKKNNKKILYSGLIIASLLSGLCFVIYQVQAAHNASESLSSTLGRALAGEAETDRTLYGNRTPECLNPQIRHLCSDYRQDNSERVFSTHYLSITCADSCENIYRFQDTIQFSYFGKAWIGDDRNHTSIQDFVVEKRVSISSREQEENEAIKRDQDDIRQKEHELAKRASNLWKTLVPQFPISILKKAMEI